MRAFIVRPFGIKEGIDFDLVERELISPALEALNVTGRTTGEIFQQGNIRTDMFQRLLTADVVVADISIHNANVFYELGIRHGLREKRTLLIRSRSDAVPFDLKTDRYLAYDKDRPADSLDSLINSLRATLDSEARDSPVFQLLPELEPPSRSQFLVVPVDFREEVDRAADRGRIGDLELLGEEAGHLGFEWEITGLRTIGKALFRLRAMESARGIWETVRKPDKNDPEACTLLGTIYQKLGDLSRSEAALNRVLSNPQVSSEQLAEVHALLGSNAKIRWAAAWEEKPVEDQPRCALQSPYLRRSLEAYKLGFAENLNHYYSGVNALAQATILTLLAENLPEVWNDGFESDQKANLELEELKRERSELSAALDLSLQSAQARAGDDPWLAMSVAVHAFLTSNRSGWVGTRYRHALAGAPPQTLSSERRQLSLYKQLGLLTENTIAALEAIDDMLSPTSAETETEQQAFSRVLVFTGHRLDAPDRPQARFPAEAEELVAGMIREAVEQELSDGRQVLGMAGGTSGGDILFHETCAELGVETHLYLAMPRDAYVPASVSAAGPDWVERFDRLHDKLATRVLGESKELPVWLRGASRIDGYTVWQRNNLWTLHNAMAHGASKVTLIALWDGGAGDGPGGTRDMIQKARDRGARTIILDAKKLLATDADPSP